MAGKSVALMALLGLSILTICRSEATDSEGENALISLDDDNFEHLTQASTGSTTGDWFVKFYIPTCPHCVRMQAAWEELAEDLNGETNVAEVNCKESAITCTRFGLSGYPTILFLRKGRYYKYAGARSVEAFKEFLTTYDSASVQAEVPGEPGLFWTFAAMLQKWVMAIETEMSTNPVRTTIIIVVIFTVFTIGAVLLANFAFTRLEAKMDGKVKKD
mmetsp:Transcript_12222/g.13364  ORF Transcript_12222/g.13364 Transcript_12222/m.13364 type:complete len:217 (+) Transcript_12222:61-711(+)